MADESISQLAAATSLATGDLLVVVDIDDTTMGASGTDKQLPLSTLQTWVTIAQSQVTGLAASLAALAPLASPALTGTPTAPTAAAGTNTTQIATTAFVMGQGFATQSYVTSQGYVTSAGAAAAAPVQSVAGKTGAVTLTGSDVPVFGASGAGHAPGAVPDPGATAGTTRYLREDGTWDAPAGGGSGTVTSVGLSMPGGFTVSGSPVTGAGTIAVTTTLSGLLKGSSGAIEVATVGTDYVVPTGSITGTAGNVTGTVAVANGGTGLTAAPANGQIPIGDGTGYTLATLTAGTGVTITNAAGAVTIAASGGGSGTVTSVGISGPASWSITGSPVTASGTIAITPTVPDVQVFTGSGTWTKPTGATVVEVWCISGGGGGGGGAVAASGTAAIGGAGANGGPIAWARFAASDVPSTVSVTVGAGGTGGPGGASTGGSGSTGASGGQTMFGAYLQTYYGQGALPGGAGNNGNGGFLSTSGGGGGSSTSGNPGSGGTSWGPGSGGGGGGGISSAGTAYAGANGGDNRAAQGYYPGGAGGAVGSAGSAGPSTSAPASSGLGGTGGGGGGASTSGPGGAGGAGGSYGGGGGGGGAALVGFAGGTGGNGGPGLCVVNSW